MQWTELRYHSTSLEDSGGQLHDVTPVPSLQGVEIECHYSGCYVGHPWYYDDHYYFTFSTATCTFSKDVQGQHYQLKWNWINSEWHAILDPV